ncbi:MAG: tRNA lysidine(34) synthetase TilS [Omnitrophica WOR_2 bacterium RBG_13_41_10]|nr:MAG: tRNA lysidine(34) synthetase TilS [Omnitrophica WOR_2 bacterium RBG_13_41_10]
MIQKQVKTTIKNYRLINKGDKIIIGVSGGPDSVALVYVLNSLRRDLKLKLHIAHLDHMLRKGSSEDRKFVEGLAQRLNLPVTCARINIREIAAGGSLEEIARNARLGFLFKVAKDNKANKIALGHNLDDQAETVLMRILRGSGLYGLSAILPKREIADFQIIRPLIETKRKEIEAFLRQKRIKPRLDVSNQQDLYLRNRIRNKLLPFLEKEYNQNIKEILSNMAQIVASDYDYLNRSALRIIKDTGSKINIKQFIRLHPAIQRIVLRLMIARKKGNMRRITFQHTKEIEDLILNRPVNSIVDLPQGLSVVKKNGHIAFYYPSKH